MSIADEIEKLSKLKADGVIDDATYEAGIRAATNGSPLHSAPARRRYRLWIGLLALLILVPITVQIVARIFGGDLEVVCKTLPGMQLGECVFSNDSVITPLRRCVAVQLIPSHQSKAYDIGLPPDGQQQFARSGLICSGIVPGMGQRTKTFSLDWRKPFAEVCMDESYDMICELNIEHVSP
jgi:hypothetical protein